jgi:DNA-binding winged helix-turn-helix (wHTH) protein/tetratricopeptide (TPR) repeat protein
MFYEFADFRVDAKKRLLFRGDEQISLTPKVFETLLTFLDHPGEVLEKDRPMNLLWADSFVEESNLAQNVAVLRKALGEDSKQHRFVLTIPGRGYRFVADVSRVERENGAVNDKPIASQVAGSSDPVVILPFRGAGQRVATLRAVSNEPEAIDAPDAPRPATESRPAWQISRYAALVALAALLTASLGFYYFSTRSPAPSEGAGNRIAVLPLKPLNVENRDPIVEFAIAESLILKLSSSKNLNVKPLTSVRRYVELDRDPTDAGRELNVDLVLASNYQIVNGKIRVTSQLWNVRTGQPEETFKSESDASNAFSMQDAVANEIGNAVLTRFGATPDSFTVKRGTSNEEAYRLYLQGMYLTEKYNRKDAARAIETFDEALNLDPTYAAAWAGKAHAHCNFAHRGGNAPIVEFANAEPALDRALAIDNKNADAYGVRGIIDRDYHWNFAEAYKNLDRALELDPNHLFAHRTRSGLLTRDGRHDEAIIEQKKAIDLNPGAIGEHWLYADALIQARRYDDAIHQADRVREMDNSFAAAYSILWRAYHFKGDHLKAYENFLQGKRLGGSSDVDIAKLETAFRDSGWFGVLRAERDARIANLESDYSPAKYDIAGFSAVLGDNERALKYLNECLDNRLIGLSSIKVDPFLDGLRGDPRFEEIVRKTGL